MKAIVFICLLIFSQSRCNDVTETTALESTTEAPQGEPSHDVFEKVYNIVVSCASKEDLLLSSNCIADEVLELGEHFLSVYVRPYITKIEEDCLRHFGTAQNLIVFVGEMLDVVRENLPDYIDIVFEFAKDTAKGHLQELSHKVMYQLLSHFSLIPVKIPTE